MSVTDEYLANNAEYAKSFSGPLPLPPSKHVAVVACMDARLNVYGVLGLNEGEAHVIRNAGGVITDDEIRRMAPQAPTTTPIRVPSIDPITSNRRLAPIRRHNSSDTGWPLTVVPKSPWTAPATQCA